MLQQDADEQVILVVRRTYFGILPHILFGIAALAAFVYGIFQLGLNPERFANVGASTVLALFVGGIVLIETIIFLIVRVYLSNTITLTTESVVQRLQMTPFANKISQLGLDGVEDVSVAQPGFLANLLNYGTLTIETAGEQQNFIFPFAKSPSKVSNQIITAKEAFEAKKHTINSATPPTPEMPAYSQTLQTPEVPVQFSQPPTEQLPPVPPVTSENQPPTPPKSS